MLSLAAAPAAFVPPTVAPTFARAGVRMQVETPVSEREFNPVIFAKALPGACAPLGFWDPLGFCAGDATEARIRFYREVEVKHGRVAMLAALGFVVAEQFHPLWGGAVDTPSYVAFQSTPLQTNWQATMWVAAVFELVSVASFMFPVTLVWRGGERKAGTQLWTLRDGAPAVREPLGR